MINLCDRLYVAGDYACPECGPGRGVEPAGGALLAKHAKDWAVIHACKSPCHQRAVGYKGNLASTHPSYLVLEHRTDLYLNMIDPPVPLFKPALFSEALRFAKSHWEEGRAVLFHCNHGRSRAPSLALLYLAKVRRLLSDKSYAAARREFELLYAFYTPGKGIETYLTEHWREIGCGS